MSIFDYIVYDNKYSIRKPPILNRLTGSANATDFFMKVLVFAAGRENRPFYKFTAPPETENSKYRPGDSWVEELEISRTEFESARKAISTRIYKGDSKNKITQQGKVNSLVFYWVDDNITYYELNPEYARVFLDEMFNFDVCEYINGVRPTREQVMERIIERAKAINIAEGPSVTASKQAIVKVQKQIQVAGKMMNYKPRKAPLSDPDLYVPVLNQSIPMHDDFQPTQEMINYALGKGWDMDEVNNLTINHITYWGSRKEKKPGWWWAWYTSFNIWDANKKRRGKNGGTGKGGSGHGTSAKRAEQYRRESEQDNFPDVTD